MQEIDLEKVEESEKKEKNEESDLAYSIEDTPPWYLCLLLGFQVSDLSFNLDFERT